MGVGVQFDFDNRILNVAEGYAADKAGIMKGDLVLGYIDHDTPNVFVKGINFRGTEGKGIDIYVLRNGKSLNLP